MDSSETEIHHQLRELKKCCTSEVDLGETAKQLVVDISEIISCLKSTLTLDLYISLLFGADGLVDFCRTPVRQNCFVAAKESCLSLFNLLIENHSSSVFKYAIPLQKLTKFLYNVEKAVGIRTKALELLCLLLLTYKRKLDIDSLRVPEFVEQIVLDVKNGKSLTLKAQQLKTLGVLSDILQTEVGNSSSLIHKVLIENLTRRSRDARQDLTIVAGALRGISFYLNKFDAIDVKIIYKVVHTYVDPNLNLPRRDCQRAALDLFHQHGSKFSEELMSNYEYLYNCLCHWCDSRNRDDHKVAMSAMDTFIIVIANTLELAYYSRGSNVGGHTTALYTFLLNKYNNVLDCGGSTNQLTMAVKGYGMLAGVSKLFLGSNAIQLMFNRILHIGHHTYFQSSEMLETKLTNLPSYIETLGIILNKIDTDANYSMETVLQLCLGLTENFPHIFEKKRFLVYRALFTLMSALKSNLYYYKEFTHSLVYHTLIHSCSYDLPIETDSDEGQGKSGNQEWTGVTDVVITYKNYLPLWEVLLSPDPGKYQRSCAFVEEHKQTAADLYNEFINCIIEIVDKIDLSIYKNDETKDSNEGDEFTCDPISGVMVKKPKDFQIYSNLACLSGKLLSLRTEQLNLRLLKLFLNFVKRSIEQPTVSTHYSMIRNLLSSANCCQYFDNEQIGEDKSTALHLLTSYALETLERCKQYKDQLLASSLFLIFELPSSIVEKILPHLIPAVQMGLRIGLSYLPIAQTCINAMENWVDILPQDLIKEYYPSVLPLFMPYLRSQESYKGEINARTVENKIVVSNQRRRIDEKKFNKSAKKSDDSDMLKVQLSIWKLLGRLEYTVCRTIVSENGEEKAVAWDCKKHIKFSIPFQDTKLDVYLDDILPNTIDLAVGSTDRQTKVAACELLHSLVILMVGTGSQRSQATEEKYPMAALYRRIFPAMFKLSCDSDSVTRQLFLTLTFQCIHWFTNNRKFENPDTAALLETIMNGLIESNDPSVREFSAKSLLEFYKWSEKQAKEKSQVLANTKSIMKRIICYCRQPSAFKRLGGCLAWNSIYQEVRENGVVCDIWTIYLLDAMFDCLQHSEGEDALIGTSEQCKIAIKHLERIIQKRRDVFSKSSSRRRIPEKCGEGTIDDVITYLFRRVGSLSSDTRHLAIEMMISLAPLCKGYPSLKQFLVENVIKSRGKSFVIGIFEGEEQGKILDFYEWKLSKFTYRMQGVYFKVLLRALDCYGWSISLGILSLQDVIKESVLFTAIPHFLKTFALHKSEYSVRQSEQEDSSFITTNQLCMLDEMKCTIIVRIFNFMQTIFHSGSSVPEMLKSHQIWNDDMFELIIGCIFAPESIGFNVTDTEIKKNLPLEVQSFLRTFRAKIGSDVVNQFQEKLLQRMNLDEFEQILPKKLTHHCCIKSEFKPLINGLNTIVEIKLLEDTQALIISKSIMKWFEATVYEIRDDDMHFTRDIGTQHFDVLQNCLQLAIAADDQARTAVLYMATSDCLVNLGNGKTTSKGAYFLSCFGNYFIQIYLQNLDELMDRCRSICKENFSEAVQTISLVIRFLLKKKEARHRHCNEVVISFLKCWTDLVQSVFENVKKLKSLRDLLMTVFLMDTNGLIKQHIRISGSENTSVLEFYTNFLLNVNLNLNEKVTALKMLPFFLSVDEVSTIVVGTVQKFRALYLPIRSTEYEINSIKDREVDSVITEILAALELTASSELLGVVVSIFCQEDDHRYLKKLQSSLEKMMKSATPIKQTTVLNYLYEGCQPPPDHRYRMVELILMPCLQFASKSALVQFFTANVVQMTLNVDEVVTGRVEDQKSKLRSKIISFSILQVMYCKLQKDQVFGPGAEINTARYADDATGKQLTKELIRVALRFAKKEMHSGENNTELRRKCACAAYNTLVAILSNVNDQLRLFEDMLFFEKPSSGEDLFSSLLNLDKVFIFGIEVDFNHGPSNRLVSVHQRATEDTELESIIPYLASHNLDGSSLREDASQFDFSSAVVLSQTSALSKNISQETSESSVSSVRLDRSDFNNHEVMANLTAIIQQLMSKDHGDLSQAQPATLELPRWMKFLKNKLDRHQPMVVKLFVLRLLTNTEAVFAPYASHFVEPVLSCVKDHVAGASINYFVVDILVMVISWGPVPDSCCDPDIISKVFEFLISTVPHLRADIFKYNLSIIKSVVEGWRGVLTVPKDVIPRLLEVKDGSKREVEAGLQISGILLANGLTPYLSDCPLTRKRYENCLIGLLDSHLSTIYVPTAEVIGLYVTKLENCEEQKTYFDKVVSKLEPMTFQKPGKFVTCMYFIQLHYAPIIKRFVSRLFNLTNNLFGVTLERAFLCLTVNALEIENISSRLEEQNVQQLLMRKESNTQFAALNFVNAVLPIMATADIRKMLPNVSNFSQHTSSKCRQKMYHILIYLYDTYINKTDPAEIRIGQDAQKYLLRAVNDPDMILRQFIINFWIKCAGSMYVKDRLLFVLEKMFNPESEDCFLILATNILLQASHLSTDFQRAIFEHALTECVFREMKVSPGWKSRHASMAPLFTETQGVSDVPIDSLISLTQAGASDVQIGVQATQKNKLFSATQTDFQMGENSSNMNTYNWLTGSSLDVDMTDSQAIPSRTPTQSTGLLFSQPQSMGDMSRYKRTDLGDRKLVSKDKNETESRTDISDTLQSNLIRRRFVKNQDKLKQNIYFARQEEMRKRRRETVERDRRAKREAQVTIYRQYRVGELPDIQIPYKAVITPLQALAERDSATASSLFSLVAQSVYENAIAESTEEDDWKERIKCSVQQVCKTSSMCVTHVMQPILNFCLCNGIHLNPQDVAQLSMKSGMQAIGILTLEQQLINADEKSRLHPPPSKRIKTSMEHSTDPKAIWLCMADLYKSLSMYDCVLGIFKTEIGVMREDTKRALDAESTGDYYEAFINYKKVLDSQGTSEEENLMAEEWYISSAEQLGQWAHVEKLVNRKYGICEESNLQRLKDVWDAPRAKRLFVPTIINSKLMRILRGSSDDGSLCEFVNDSREIGTWRQFLETELPYQLAVLAVNQEKWEEAKMLLSASQIATLTAFANCSLVTSKSLIHKLTLAQPIRELEDFLMLSELSGDEFVVRSLQTVKRWKSNKLSFSSQSQSLQLMTFSRDLYCHFLLPRLPNEKKDVLNSAKILNHVEFAYAALDRSNPLLSYKHIEVLKKISTGSPESYHLYILLTRVSLDFCRQQTEPAKRFSHVITGWKFFDKIKGCTLLPDNLQCDTLRSELCLELCNAIRILGDNWYNANDFMDYLKNKFPQVESDSKEAWYGTLLNYSYKNLANITKPQNVMTKSTLLPNAYNSIAKFCEESMKYWTDHINLKDYSKMLIESVLRSMAEGCQEAMYKFPRILYLIEHDLSLMEIFKRFSGFVPVWMFLQWINHILIYIDKPLGSALFDIVENIARTYPQAVCYPFDSCQLSSITKLDSDTRQFCNRIEGILGDIPLLREFSSSFSDVHLPHLEVRDSISVAFRAKTLDPVLSEVRKIYGVLNSACDDCRSHVNLKGAIYANVGQILECKKIFIKMFGPNLNKLNGLGLPEIKKALLNIKSVLDSLESGKLSNKLRNYSPWLANFKYCNYLQDIEVPGQYCGSSKPLPEYHSKISTFDENIRILTSLRMPIQVKIYGTNKKEYPFLVKYGEDLRTDQRMEQLFNLMNNIYSRSEHRLSCQPKLRTFSVIPLSFKTGLLQWVSGTQTLRAFIHGTTSIVEKKQLVEARELCLQANNFSIGPKCASNKTCVRAYEKCVEKINWDILRKSISNMAVSNEGFFHLRSTFVSSYATLCISNWLLGIGDRHLDNFLVDLKTAEVIGIDFGHHFESASQFLPIPELIPFRLTPQIINVTKPLGTNGPFKEIMIRCLALLAQSKETILAAVEAFIKSPTEDWLNFILMQENFLADPSKIMEYSSQKLENIRKKLSGSHPSYITQWSASKNQTLVKYKLTQTFSDIILGKGCSNRGSKNIDGLSITEQVEILIEQATDPNILGRTYGNWQPFI